MTVIPGLDAVTNSECSIMNEPSPTKLYTRAPAAPQFGPQCGIDLVAHTGVAVLDGNHSRRGFTPDTLEVARQAARRRHHQRAFSGNIRLSTPNTRLGRHASRNSLNSSSNTLSIHMILNFRFEVLPL